MALKRCIVLLPALALIACEPEGEIKQVRDAGARLERATAMLAPSAMGTRHVQRSEDAPGFDEYRVKLLAEAAQEVQPVADSGSPAQQLAARSLMAEADAAAARLASRQASEAWTAQNALAAQIVSTASNLGASARMAAEQSQIDYDPQLADLRKQEMEATAQIDQLEQVVANAQAEIDKLNKQIETSEQARMKAAEAGGDLSRKAFQADGKLRHDLTVQAAEASRQAEKASAETERLQAQLSVAQSALAVEQARLNAQTALLEQLQQATADVQKRDQAAAQQADKYRSRVAELEKEFEAMFKQLAEQQQSAVLAPMATAAEEYAQAIAHLEAAMNVASGEARQAAELTLATTRAEYGMELQKQAAIHRAYAALLDSLAKAAQQNLPQRAAAVAEAATAATKTADEAQALAAEQLTTASQALQQILESASGQQEIESAALRSLIAAQNTLSILTGDKAAAQNAQQLTERLRQLNAPPPAPAPEQPAEEGAAPAPAPAPAPEGAAPAPALP